MTVKEIIVNKQDGLNTRSAAQLVQTACRFSSSIMIRRASVFINAKSMVGVLSLGSPRGSVLVFEADGADERKAIRAIEELLSSPD